MILFNIFIGISIGVIGLVVYSALVVSGRQGQTIRHIRKENEFESEPHSQKSSRKND